jgi:hypothetical protein
MVKSSLGVQREGSEFLIFRSGTTVSMTLVRLDSYQSPYRFITLGGHERICLRNEIPLRKPASFQIQRMLQMGCHLSPGCLRIYEQPHCIVNSKKEIPASKMVIALNKKDHIPFFFILSCCD